MKNCNRGNCRSLNLAVFLTVLGFFTAAQADPMFWQEEKKFHGSDTDFFDLFGSSMAESNGILAIGADNAGAGTETGGAVYLFYGNADETEWIQEKIVKPNLQEGDVFGRSVGLDGSILVVGAPGDDTVADSGGAVYIFYKDKDGANNWGLEKKIVSPIADSDYFGTAVAVLGTTVVVSAVRPNAYNKVFIYEKDQGGQDNWGLVKELLGSDTSYDDSFGAHVSLSGEYLAVSAEEHDALKGAVYLFKKNLGGVNNWGELKKIQPSNSAYRNYFGLMVSLSDDILAVAGSDVSGTDKGAVYIYSKDFGGAENWGEVHKITCPDLDSCYLFARTLSLYGDLIAVGDQQDSTYDTYTGAVYVFRMENSDPANWILEKTLYASDPAWFDEFGDMLLVVRGEIFIAATGKPHQDGNPEQYAGYVYLFRYARAQGDQCVSNIDCHTGFCVDGVCCNSFCGGDNPDDCQACSVESGSTDDGLCVYRTGGASCDDEQFCTVNDICDGLGNCSGNPRNCAPEGSKCYASVDCDEDNDTCVTTPAHPDADGDGHVDQDCGGDDCADNDPDVFPGHQEILCDGLDNDCNPGTTDDNDATDFDQDGYSIGCGDDCDDFNNTVYPGATEICADGIDQDCDGSDLECDCQDADNDGYKDSSCGGDDCDDFNNTVYPGATEICEDGIDQDCNGSDLECDCRDADNDGYKDSSCGGDDCDDFNNTVYPGATEICADGIDNNCDGKIDGQDSSCPLAGSDDSGCGCSSGKDGGGLLFFGLGLLCVLMRPGKRRRV